MGETESNSFDYIKNLMKAFENINELEIDNVTIHAEELSFIIQPIMTTVAEGLATYKPLDIKRLMNSKFTIPLENFSGQISEVQIGSTKSEGGSRGRIVKIGGAKTMPFYSFEFENQNRPAFAMDIFDMPLKLAKMVRVHYEDVVEDPAEWAKRCVELGADVVSLNLISTDPLLNDTSPKEAAKVVEKVLQAVDSPIIIGGSGNKKKDPFVLEAAAEVAAGERIILNSANTDNDYKRIVKAAIKHNHSVIAFTPMDINNQKKLNRMLLNEGLPKDHLIIDPTTAALGYGLDYSISIMERIRLAGLLGDEDLQMPILSPASNAWGAREAWMKNDELGPVEYRGPLWETITALTMALSGADLFMLSHPASVRVLKSLIDDIRGISAKGKDVDDWITCLG